MPNGAYRLSGMQVLQNEAQLIAQKHNNCSYDERFHDELTSVKHALNLSAGVWVGLMLEMDGVTEVLALQME